jgi:hypothetical protein
VIDEHVSRVTDSVRVTARWEELMSMLSEIVKSWVPRDICSAYFCLLVSRVQATVSHNHEED